MTVRSPQDRGPRRLRLAVALAVLLPSVPARAGEFALYLLSGQSNMDGYGTVAELPPELAGPQEGAWIYHGDGGPDGVPADGRGLWTPLVPGHGRGYGTDGVEEVFSDRFGVELSFAARLRERHPDREVALVKASRGGTSIDARAAGGAGCWDPDFEGGEGTGAGVNQYDHCLATIRAALAVRDIDGDGEDDVLVPAGILWMQGESDANASPDVALAYRENLVRLMDLLRAALHADDLPVAIGRISDSGLDDDGRVWTWGEVVRTAQAAACDADPAMTLVTTTDAYGYSDPWHYDTAGYLDLGRAFADALDPPVAEDDASPTREPAEGASR